MERHTNESSIISKTTNVYPRVTVLLVIVLGSFALVAIALVEVGLNQDSFARDQSGHNITTSASNSTAINTTSPSTINLPLSKGFVNGRIAYFIATDASSNQLVSSISNTTNFKLNYAPSLANTSESSRQQGYVFINGIKGEGPLGSQLSVASALPGDKGYSPLFQINYVKWNLNATKHIPILKSVDEILGLQNSGGLTITKSNVVVNSPAVSIKSPP
jgi:hypothetical protein